MFEMMKNRIAFATDDAATGGTPVESADSSAGDVLLSGNADPDPAPAEGGDSWQEYVSDPGKTDEENAALKAEHDKGKPVDGDDKKDDDAVDPADVVPEDGKYQLALPDGIELDQGLLDRAAPVMKELGLTNAQASKLAGVIAEQRKTEFDALNSRHQKIVEDWQTEIRSDRDFGGDGLDVSLNTANRVIATFGDDAFRRDLTEIGIGNHPGLFRLLVRVGNAISDDKPATSETPASPKAPPEQAMYGSTTPMQRG